MFLKIWMSYITGYLRIKVEGYFVERFINSCINKKILLWNTKREKTTILYTNIGIKEYRQIRKIARKTKSKVHVEGKKGLPFVMHKYRKRKIFLGLLVTIFIGIIILSKFIWNVDIKGNINVTKEDIIQALSEEGLNVGNLKSKVNTNHIINKIRLKRDDIAWIGITLRGTNAIVEIKEIDKAPEIIDKDKYCNIVSDKSGIVTKVNVQNGTALVKEGDVIQEGSILVAGYLEGKYTGIRYVHSVAEIEAKVWYTKKGKFYFAQQVAEPTGLTEEKYSININNFKINLYKTLSKFKNYDTINESKKLKVFSDFYLPIQITKTTNKEYQYKDITYTEEELTNIAIEKLAQELEQEIDNTQNIINKQVNTYGKEGYIEVEVIYEVLENVGREDEIVF